MNTLKQIIISFLTIIITLWILFNFVPFSLFEGGVSKKLGTTSITTILGTDTLSASRTTINNNFSSLNSNKVEISDLAATTSLSQLTTLSALSTVGTITSGIWNGTAIGVGYGGTGTTSPAQYQVLLGNGAGGITVASSTGTSGQYFVSNGAGAYPSWQTVGFDQAQDYTLTGNWTYNSGGTATTTFNRGVDFTNTSLSSTAIRIRGLNYLFPSSHTATSTVLANDGAGNLYWADYTDKKQFIDAGSAVANDSNTTFGRVSATNFVPVVNLADGVVAATYFPFQVPPGVGAISSIKLIYSRTVSANARLTFAIERVDTDSYPTTGQTDTTDSEATYTSGASDESFASFTVPTGAYDGITYDSGDYLSIRVERNGASASDTFNAVFTILGVEITY